MHISIHSLRVEGDPGAVKLNLPILYFNPLPPCGGRRQGRFAGRKFLSISIHSLRVEGDVAVVALDDIVHISIHSLRVEGDVESLPSLQRILFQSTPSVWRETADVT